MKRPGDKCDPPGGNAEKRRRLFEGSRGLFGRRALPLDEKRAGDAPDSPEPPPNEEELPRDENERDAERPEQ
jgi:hypothetical protein